MFSRSFRKSVSTTTSKNVSHWKHAPSFIFNWLSLINVSTKEVSRNSKHITLQYYNKLLFREVRTTGRIGVLKTRLKRGRIVSSCNVHINLLSTPITIGTRTTLEPPETRDDTARRATRGRERECQGRSKRHMSTSHEILLWYAVRYRHMNVSVNVSSVMVIYVWSRIIWTALWTDFQDTESDPPCDIWSEI